MHECTGRNKRACIEQGRTINERNLIIPNDLEKLYGLTIPNEGNMRIDALFN
jgi:hypothetical protein